MRGACIRLSRMMPVPLRLPHNYTPVFFNTLDRLSAPFCRPSLHWLYIPVARWHLGGRVL